MHKIVKYKLDLLSRWLIFTSSVLIHFNQLKFVPFPTTTRPIFHFFLLPIFALLIFYRKNDILWNKVKKLWLILILIFICYSFIGFIIHGNLLQSARYVISIIFAFIFYFFGYYFAYNTKVLKIILYSFFMLVVPFGILHIFSMTVYGNLNSFICNIRDSILSQNLECNRLALFFSEPSFLASYFLLMYFLSERLSKTNKTMGKILKFIIIIFAIFSKSLYVYITFFSLFILKVLKNRSLKGIIFNLIIFAIFIVIVFSFLWIRIVNAFTLTDVSTYIRFLYISANLKLFLNSLGLGSGLGSFGFYFPIFLEKNVQFIPNELLPYVLGERLALPFSLSLQILSETGLFGFIIFTYLFFQGFKKSPFKEYYIITFLITFSALPWGLPYLWVLLGTLHRESLKELRYEKN